MCVAVRSSYCFSPRLRINSCNSGVAKRIGYANRSCIFAVSGSIGGIESQVCLRAKPEPSVWKDQQESVTHLSLPNSGHSCRTKAAGLPCVPLMMSSFGLNNFKICAWLTRPREKSPSASANSVPNQLSMYSKRGSMYSSIQNVLMHKISTNGDDGRKTNLQE